MAGHLQAGQAPLHEVPTTPRLGCLDAAASSTPNENRLAPVPQSKILYAASKQSVLHCKISQRVVLLQKQRYQAIMKRLAHCANLFPCSRLSQVLVRPRLLQLRAFGLVVENSKKPVIAIKDVPGCHVSDWQINARLCDHLQWRQKEFLFK